MLVHDHTVDQWHRYVCSSFPFHFSPSPCSSLPSSLSVPCPLPLSYSGSYPSHVCKPVLTILLSLYCHAPTTPFSLYLYTNIYRPPVKLSTSTNPETISKSATSSDSPTAYPTVPLALLTIVRGMPHPIFPCRAHVLTRTGLVPPVRSPHTTLDDTNAVHHSTTRLLPYENETVIGEMRVQITFEANKVRVCSFHTFPHAMLPANALLSRYSLPHISSRHDEFRLPRVLTFDHVYTVSL